MSVKEVALNKKARFLYHIKEKFEAGIVLMGSEVKSLRKGRCHIKEAYISFRKQEAYLQKAHISTYGPAALNGHQPERLRKLLLNRKELEKIEGLVQQKKMTCIPTRIYFKNGKAKVEIALAIGKTKGDKRDSEKTKRDTRQIERALKHKRNS